MTEQVSAFLLFALKSFFTKLGFIVIVISLLSIVFQRYWLGDLIANFRMQYAATLFIFAIALFFFRAPVIAVWFLLVAVINFSYVFPYFPRAVHRVKPAVPVVRLTTINVLVRNKKIMALQEHIRSSRSDIVVLEEVPRRYVPVLQRMQGVYPYVISDRSRFKDRIVILSRYPILYAKTHFIGKGRVPALLARFDIRGKSFQIVGVHLHNPVTRHGFAVRNTELTALAGMAQQEKGAFAVVGDFNTTPWSYYFRRFLQHSGLHNAMRGRGAAPTWLKRMVFLAIPIDHIAVSSGITVLKREVGVDIGSDHFPVTVDLEL